ncbi:3-isopropylmalate dehydratase, large subunit [Thermodesulfatator indicus DSM 15286]|uniref:3-isopropylmalate dehydratase large subunit n=1 Tax=Thermodesulfatator indicus (strain DSM 15286 / JCM 11887 / CIR29812) TaxID=667014 RepID=F8AC10_THEID|nr:3-isopropylmalate dehydratase large subunit [Thermodesulfatator indicus]AEH45709.1 3-isopropylmalate dehydratase, large subunit [Thermodesulfatator indicus DSM 15286]
MKRPMTLAEKLLAAKAGLPEVEPGQLIDCPVDLALANDITAPIAIKIFREAGFSKVFDRNKIILVMDHFTPNKDIQSAEQVRLCREFAREQGIVHYYEGGNCGIEHVLLPEKGLVVPGDVVIGADSHTCTYGALGTFATGMGSTDVAAAWITGRTWFRVPESIKFVYRGELKPWVTGKDLILYTIGDIGVDGALYKAMEFTGEVIKRLSMAERFTMSNMAIEAGAKVGLIAPDKKTLSYVRKHSHREPVVFKADRKAKYLDVIEYDCSKIEPQVAFPHLPSNTKPISEVGHIDIDQVVIGSCTNGRIEDLAVAAKILAGRQVNPNVRAIIIPGSPKVYREALRKKYIDIFVEAGAIVSPPTCGPCLGGHMGILAKGEKAISTTNRNFLGRMGHPESEVYLASPAVAAASAVLGRIASPEELGL